MKKEKGLPGVLHVALVLNLWLLPLLLCLAGFSGVARAAENAPTWKNTNMALPTGSPAVCFDGMQPWRLLAASKGSDDLPAGTYAFDWQTGQRTRLNERPFSLCNEGNGRLYAAARGTEGALHFTSQAPNGQAITYTPDEVASDGTDQVYALAAKKLFASSNGGLDWQERGQALGPNLQAVSASQTYGLALYALAKTKYSPTEDTYSLHFSPNGGQTWEKRYEANYASTTSLVINAGLGRAAPPDTLMLHITTRLTGTFQTTSYISSNGGRAFTQVDQNNLAYQKPTPDNRKFIITAQGLLKFSNRFSRNLEITRSTDWGKTWQALAVPAGLVNDPAAQKEEFGKAVALQQAEWSPDNLFLSFSDGTGRVWHSSDGGLNWQALVSNMPDLKISPYAPLTLIGIKTRKLYLLELPEAGKALANGVLPDRLPGNLFFPETGHNLGGAFRAYWQQNGGLAQFGFPRTELFREINPSDGKIYTVQYFERNRFEYHPEHKGTRYEVLLGLLGNQAIEQRQDKSEAAFKVTENRHYPGGVYFEQTGHNLAAGFKAYWEANGGLAIYGYPISEEFEEINPEDGKTYTVQYFERNRFEYHPENKGTRYEVLLGLLGNKLLKDKGWLV
jgi:hypothetical protein